MWFRKEQLLTVTWAGDPAKPMVGNDPLELSPRRSFAAWSEIVRGTALPWTSGELALARAIGAALVDIIVQVNAVRLLIAEHQLAQMRATVRQLERAGGRRRRAAGALLFANEAFRRLTRQRAARRCPTWTTLAAPVRRAGARARRCSPRSRGDAPALARRARRWRAATARRCRWRCAPRSCRRATARCSASS